MLIIVIAKPIQFTIVKAVPFTSAFADCATSVENCGESATTAIPQKSNKIKNAGKKNRIKKEITNSK